MPGSPRSLRVQALNMFSLGNKSRNPRVWNRQNRKDTRRLSELFTSSNRRWNRLGLARNACFTERILPMILVFMLAGSLSLFWPSLTSRHWELISGRASLTDVIYYVYTPWRGGPSPPRGHSKTRRSESDSATSCRWAHNGIEPSRPSSMFATLSDMFSGGKNLPRWVGPSRRWWTILNF